MDIKVRHIWKARCLILLTVSGISCARGEPARPGCQNFGSPTIFVPVDCSEVILKIASKECEEDIGGRNRESTLAQERPDCYNIVDWSWIGKVYEH